MITYTLCFYREETMVIMETKWGEEEGNPKTDSVNKQYRKEKTKQKIKKRKN